MDILSTIEKAAQTAGAVVQAIKGPPPLGTVQDKATASVPYYVPGETPGAINDANQTAYENAQRSAVIQANEQLKMALLVLGAGVVAYVALRR